MLLFFVVFIAAATLRVLHLFRVYNELLESVQALHPFFVHFSLNDILNQDEFVKGDAEIVSSYHDSRLLLDSDSCPRILWISFKVV